MKNLKSISLKTGILSLSLKFLAGAGVWAWPGMAEAIEPTDRFFCEHDKVKLEVDLYATGHPMSGIGMYSGLMEIWLGDSNLREIVPIEAFPSERPKDAYKIQGDSPDLGWNRYTVYFKELPDPKKATAADLKIIDISPFPSKPEWMFDLKCTMVQIKN